MPICKNCEESFPKTIVLDGKERNLQNRKYCLRCSPFGSHNTRRLHTSTAVKEPKTCQCGRSLDGTHRATKCYVCIQKGKGARREDAVYSIVGNACWKCGYDKGTKGRSVLDFHHVHPDQKSFSLNRRHIANYAWDRVLAEMKKCVLLCSRCHREEGCGLISQEEILGIFGREWADR